MAHFTSTSTRRRFAGFAAVIVALSLLTACLNPEQDYVLTSMNVDRTANHRGALRVQQDAQAKAQAWANRLAWENRLYHSKLPDGIKVRWCSLGENVGYGPSVSAIEGAYMKSPGHRANILSKNWNGVGVGVAHRGNTVFTVHVFIKTC